MADSSATDPDARATGAPAEQRPPARSVMCSTCRKLPDCFGRLFCPNRDRG